MVVGLVVSLCAGSLAPAVFGRPGLAWTWNVAVGALVTVAVGLAASRLLGGPAPSVSREAPASAPP